MIWLPLEKCASVIYTFFHISTWEILAPAHWTNTGGEAEVSCCSWKWVCVCIGNNEIQKYEANLHSFNSLSYFFDCSSIKSTMLSPQHPLTKSHTRKSCTICCRFFPWTRKLPRQSICAARGRKLGNLRSGAQEWPLVLKLKLHQSYGIQNEDTDGNFYTQPRTILTHCRYGHNPHTNGAQCAGSDGWAERNASTYECCIGTHLAKWTAETGHPWDNLLGKMHLSERCWEEHANGRWPVAPAFPSRWLNHWVTQMRDRDSKIHREKLYVYVLSSLGLLDQQEHAWCHVYSCRRAANGLLGAQSSAMNKIFSIRAACCYAFSRCLIHTRSPWRQIKRRKSPSLPSWHRGSRSSCD